MLVTEHAPWAVLELLQQLVSWAPSPAFVFSLYMREPAEQQKTLSNTLHCFFPLCLGLF